MSGSASPDVLVTTSWVAGHLGDASVRLIEADLDPESYAEGHIAGAVLWKTWGDLLDEDERLKDDPVTIAELLGRSGIHPDTTVVLYGDSSNWGAALAFWVLRAVGHRDVRIVDGGRRKWIGEGRPTTTEEPRVAPADYPVVSPDWSHRARREDVLAAIDAGQSTILDVRLRAEYDGELFRPSGPPAEGQRAGHIPGAVHVPWETAINDDGTFKPASELRAAYEAAGITADRDIIPYCTVGGRSGHTWFVLSQLLGYPNVRLYEASWAEWGQTEGLPVA
jgi:thiosulfate/3-mercaptopyruvate sulfurtransferase